MQKFGFWVVLLAPILFIACKKDEPKLAGEEIAMESRTWRSHSPFDRNCDVSQIISNGAGYDENFVNAIKKEYDERGRITRIEGWFQDIVGVGPLAPLRVIYLSRQIILIDEADGDTVGLFDLNPAGRPTRFLSSNLYNFNAPTPIERVPEAFIERNMNLNRYLYQHGRLKEIQEAKLVANASGYDTLWRSKAIIEYDHNKNVSKLLFPHPPSFPFPDVNLPPNTISYFYNYSKVPRAQLYLDEISYRTYSFPRFLSLFPELNPKNLLVKANWHNTEWEDDREWLYTNQQFDGTGKLVFYKTETRKWILKWKCVSDNYQHDFNARE